MPSPEGFTAVCVDKATRKQLKYLSAEYEAPMCGILSALVEYALTSPAWLHMLLHPDTHEAPSHDHAA